MKYQVPLCLSVSKGFVNVGFLIKIFHFSTDLFVLGSCVYFCCRGGLRLGGRFEVGLNVNWCFVVGISGNSKRPES